MYFKKNLWEPKINQPHQVVNRMDTASSFLYDINTVLIFSLIYSILFSTNIVERTEKRDDDINVIIYLL